MTSAKPRETHGIDVNLVARKPGFVGLGDPGCADDVDTTFKCNLLSRQL